MKASKIIKLLQERIKAYGDAEVIYTYDNIGVDIGKETSYYFYSNDDNDVELRMDGININKSK